MTSTKASLRWRLLRHHLLHKQDSADNHELTKISRRPHGHFGLIKIKGMNLCNIEEETWQEREHQSIMVKYCLLANPVVNLDLIQRKDDGARFSDFAYATENQIDMTGLLGLWPAEEVLAHFCIFNRSLFRNKRVVELGSGYGLGGLAVAACTEASQVILTDGNPQINAYTSLNIRRNIEAFGSTEVKAHLLHWSDNVPSFYQHSFDIVIAADCTFFSDSHTALANTVKGLLRKTSDSQALFFNPQRDGSLNAFLQIARALGLNAELKEQYDAETWSIHEKLMRGDASGWCNYDMDHCYPLLAILKNA